MADETAAPTDDPMPPALLTAGQEILALSEKWPDLLFVGSVFSMDDQSRLNACMVRTAQPEMALRALVMTLVGVSRQAELSSIDLRIWLSNELARFELGLESPACPGLTGEPGKIN